MAPVGRMHDPWEHDVTASPDSSIDKIPSEPLPGKLASEELRSAGTERGPSRTGLRLWLHRILTLLFVFFCATVGVLLVILPWRPEWTDNYFLLGSPGLRAFVSNGFVRGLCSGLGLLDIWIGFGEAVHFHDETRS
ncbi:MAG: hypothetical protein ACRD20_19975 [Terriglobales bacterium]